MNSNFQRHFKTRCCPICGREYTEYPAISRRDNKTKICSVCAQQEALEIMCAYYGEIDARKRIISDEEMHQGFIEEDPEYGEIEWRCLHGEQIDTNAYVEELKRAKQEVCEDTDWNPWELYVPISYQDEDHPYEKDERDCGIGVAMWEELQTPLRKRRYRDDENMCNGNKE